MSDKKKKAARAGGFNTDGLCVSLVYKNDLPEPPYPPKFLSVRDLLPADRFVKYGRTQPPHTPAPGVGSHAAAQFTSASLVGVGRTQPAARQWRPPLNNPQRVGSFPAPSVCSACRPGCVL